MTQDPHYEQLLGHIRQWARRRHLRDTLVWLPRALLIGLLLAVLLAAAARFRPLLTNEEVGYLALGLGLAGLLAGAIALLSQRATLLQQARFADRQFHLQERVTTAVELHTGRVTAPAPFPEQQLQDTLQAAAAVDTRQALPLRLIRQDWLMLLLAALLLLAAVWLPNPQASILLHQRAIAQTIEEQVAALEALTEEIMANPELSAAGKEALLEPLQTAIERLQNDDLNQAQAVAVLSEA